MIPEKKDHLKQLALCFLEKALVKGQLNLFKLSKVDGCQSKIYLIPISKCNGNVSRFDNFHI